MVVVAAALTVGSPAAAPAKAHSATSATSPRELVQTSTIRHITDLRTLGNCWGTGRRDVTMNRYQPTERCGVWQPANESAMSPPPVAWPSGGGIYETRTAWGPGFKVVATPEMTAPWGGKQAWLVDVDHLTPWSSFLGTTEDWAGKLTFPRAGNPEGFPVHWWSGLLWEFHTETVSGHHIAIDGRNPKKPRLRYGVYDPRTDEYQFTWFPKPIVFDRWYSWRLRVKWSTGPDGFVRGWLNGRRVMDYVGPTIEVGEHPKIQFGYYSTPVLRNEVVHAAIRKVTAG